MQVQYPSAKARFFLFVLTWISLVVIGGTLLASWAK